MGLFIYLLYVLNVLIWVPRVNPTKQSMWLVSIGHIIGEKVRLNNDKFRFPYLGMFLCLKTKFISEVFKISLF